MSEETLVNQQLLIPGCDWDGGAFAPPIAVPEFDGPMFTPSDGPLLRYWLSFVVHCRALQVFYRAVDDRKQRQRWVDAEDSAFKSIQRLFPMSVSHLRAMAVGLVAPLEYDLSAGQEAGWNVHALFVIRQIEITWRDHKIPNLALVARCREMVVRSIRCAIPAEFADEILSEDVCSWSRDATPAPAAE